MKKSVWVFVLVLIALAITTVAAQETSTPAGIPVRMVVTVEAKHGSNVPEINREDVMVYEGRDRDKVTDWIPLQGDRAGLQLFVLIDDASAASLGSQLEDLRQFMLAQPASTKIGVAYMQMGLRRSRRIQPATMPKRLRQCAFQCPVRARSPVRIFL